MGRRKSTKSLLKDYAKHGGGIENYRPFLKSNGGGSRGTVSLVPDPIEHRMIHLLSDTESMITIGQYMQVDECEVAVNLISDDGTQIIGKPIMYCAFEPVAQIIIGAYIGLINNSMGGFNNLLLSMLEPHNNQTEPYGVTCTDENFPSMVIPKNFYSDQGSEYMSVHMEQAMLELGIAQSIVPAAAGSYKGGVENCFHRLQAKLKTLLINDGYILETHDGAKNARSNACLTMHDFKTIVYRLIIEINTTSLGKNYSPDADMIENHVPAVPSEIWKHKMKTCYDPISVTDSNKMQIMFALLWRDKRFDIGRDGLVYHSHNLRYFVDEPWFIELLKEKTPVFDVRYDDTDVSCIYVRYKKQIHKVPLAISRDELRSYVGLTWGAYDELFKQHKALMKEQKRKDAQVRLTTAHQNKKTRDAAKVLHDGIVNDKKEIKENRATQRQFLKFDVSNSSLENLVGIAEDTGCALGFIGNTELISKMNRYPRLVGRTMLNRIEVGFKEQTNQMLFRQAIRYFWQYQWTKEFTELTNEIMDELVRDSMYNIAILKALLMRIQFQAISKFPKDGITPEYIHEISESRFAEVRTLVLSDSTETEHDLMLLLQKNTDEITDDAKKLALRARKNLIEKQEAEARIWDACKLKDVKTMLKYFGIDESQTKRALTRLVKQDANLPNMDSPYIVDAVRKLIGDASVDPVFKSKARKQRRKELDEAGEALIKEVIAQELTTGGAKA